MEPSERIRVIIELEVGSDPIAGRIAQGEDEEWFVGWLALVGALERLARASVEARRDP